MQADAASRRIAYCALAITLALYVVGYVSHGVLRHIVQTAPLWIVFAAGFRKAEWSKWMALPCFLVWIFLMSLIWLFLLGLSHMISGTFSPIETAMTIAVGAASIVGIVTALRWRTQLSLAVKAVVFLGALALQVLALKISFLPRISHD